MSSLVRTLLVLLSLLLVLDVSEAGLLKERLLSRSKFDDLYSGRSPVEQQFDEWFLRSPEGVQADADREKDETRNDYRTKFSPPELYRRQKNRPHQCRFASCGK